MPHGVRNRIRRHLRWCGRASRVGSALRTQQGRLHRDGGLSLCCSRHVAARQLMGGGLLHAFHRRLLGTPCGGLLLRDWIAVRILISPLVGVRPHGDGRHHGEGGSRHNRGRSPAAGRRGLIGGRWGCTQSSRRRAGRWPLTLGWRHGWLRGRQRCRTGGGGFAAPGGDNVLPTFGARASNPSQVRGHCQPGLTVVARKLDHIGIHGQKRGRSGGL